MMVEPCGEMYVQLDAIVLIFVEALKHELIESLVHVCKEPGSAIQDRYGGTKERAVFFQQNLVNLCRKFVVSSIYAPIFIAHILVNIGRAAMNLAPFESPRSQFSNGAGFIAVRPILTKIWCHLDFT